MPHRAADVAQGGHQPVQHEAGVDAGAQRAHPGLLTGAVELAMEAHGTFVAMNNRVSQSVPHFHVHIVPRRRKDGLRGFFWPRYPYKSEDEARAAQSAIRRAISALGVQNP